MEARCLPPTSNPPAPFRTPTRQSGYSRFIDEKRSPVPELAQAAVPRSECIFLKTPCQTILPTHTAHRPDVAVLSFITTGDGRQAHVSCPNVSARTALCSCMISLTRFGRKICAGMCKHDLRLHVSFIHSVIQRHACTMILMGIGLNCTRRREVTSNTSSFLLLLPIFGNR